MAQVPPVSVYPVLQVHAYELGPVSAHVPAAAGPHGVSAQSSMSKQVMPSPLYPEGHASQVKPSSGAGMSWHITST